MWLPGRVCFRPGTTVHPLFAAATSLLTLSNPTVFLFGVATLAATVPLLFFSAAFCTVFSTIIVFVGVAAQVGGSF